MKNLTFVSIVVTLNHPHNCRCQIERSLLEQFGCISFSFFLMLNLHNSRKDCVTLICNYPKEVYSLLVPSSDFDVTANFLIDEFVVLYSEAGHNNRTKEESVYLSWCKYIMECSGKYIGYMMCASLLNTHCR